MIGLLSAAPRDITAPIREGGGGDNWIWRGEPKATEARVEVVVGPHFYPDKKGQSVRYSLGFGPFFFGVPNLKEQVGAVEQAERGEDSSERYLTRGSGKVTLSYRDESGKRSQRELSLRRTSSTINRSCRNSRIHFSIPNSRFWGWRSPEFTSIESGPLAGTLHRDCRRKLTSPTTSWGKTEETLAWS